MSETVQWDKGVQTSVAKEIIHGDEMYSMENTVNNIVISLNGNEWMVTILIMGIIL